MSNTKLLNLMHDTANRIICISANTHFLEKEDKYTKEERTEFTASIKQCCKDLKRILDDYYAYQKVMNEQSTEEKS